MESTYVYLKNVYQKLKQENSQNPSLFFVVLVLWCIPLSYSANSIALALLVANVLFRVKKKEIKLQYHLLVPILLYVVMTLSLLWTRDYDSSIRALAKGLPLLLLPLCFLAIPDRNGQLKQKSLQYFSYGIFAFTAYYFTKAAIRYLITKDSSVFFYHELVTEDVNAIHVSVYVAVAAFYFLTKAKRSLINKAIFVTLLIFLILLSSKNIIVIFFGLVVVYFVKTLRLYSKKKTLWAGATLAVILLVLFNGKVKDRFLLEYKSNVEENSVNNEIGSPTEKVYNVTVNQAWNQEYFQQNDFFPGTAFRVYQARIFFEMLQEDAVFFTGYGLNATDFKIEEKGRQHHLYPGYLYKNFHNEYIQIFAELGVFALILILIMVFLNLKNGLKNKDFMHISFAVLMISLFLTESFLSRQRGIVFFTVMYCLFNHVNQAPTLNKT